MEDANKQWNHIYTIGGITTIIVLIGIITDMVVGSITGGNIATLPQTAIERFAQFHSNKLLGLYNLDLLNIINQLIMIPSIFALYTVHRKAESAKALLALILFLVGTTIFVTNNTALTMLDLSNKFYTATSETQKQLIAAAGEAMLTKGAHGSSSVFIGFALPTIANILISWVMLKGNIFSKTNSYIGILGSLILLIYIILVTFVPAASQLALIIAMPGGLLVMAWMVMFTIKLFRLRAIND